ncbi:MAG: hypothetical protein P4L98_14720, partial [Ancalomicrobiaceae bacterium]|nr:hypothetical protein [Ancalomicrobiaceae bacterium]
MTESLLKGDWLAVGAVALLGAASALIAPSSLTGAAMLAMLPFAAILGIAAIGQQFVIQQRGLDLSVGGTISLVCVIATYELPNAAPLSGLIGPFALAIVAAMLAGAAN